MPTPFLICILISALISVSAAKTHKVSVKTRFGPSSFNANVGDVVQIHFTTGNASFTQSTFDQPCVPLLGGLDSGFINIPPGKHVQPHDFNFTLTSLKPIFFFNKQTVPRNECMHGFVGQVKFPVLCSINPNSSHPASAFRAKVMDLNAGDLVNISSVTLNPSASTSASSQSTRLAGSPTNAKTLSTTFMVSFTTTVSSPILPTSLTAKPTSNPLSGVGSQTSNAGNSVPTTMASAAGSNTSMDGISYFVTIFAILLGVAILMASLLALLVVLKKRRIGAATLPQGTPQPGGSTPLWQVWALQLVGVIQRHTPSFYFRPRFKWNRLDDPEAAYISAFHPPRRSVSFEGNIYRPPENEPARHGSVRSEFTLVPDSGRSLSVQLSEPDSEKDITQAER
ncbi:hypothetical protein JB92DRAFT_2824332 [Gautieria morchelliformis]|nr:hypothetical protein JB92DRAFT_2824332 [Gautieria morchelliformis]